MVFIVIFLVLAIGGRWACSAICPLGIIQEVIFQIPFPKKLLQLPYEKYLDSQLFLYCHFLFIARSVNIFVRSVYVWDSFRKYHLSAIR